MKKILSSQQIRQVDAHTIQTEPISSLDLMERAATRVAERICELCDKNRRIIVFAGPGNNGGDALAVARMLVQQGYRVSVFLFNIGNNLSADCQTNKNRLKLCPSIDFHEITTDFVPPAISSDDVIVDGLFGTGLSRPLMGGFASVVKYINSSEATVISIDIPSGLMTEDNTANVMTHVVQAAYTFTFQYNKLAFLFAENEHYVGKLEVLDIGLHDPLSDVTTTPYYLFEETDAVAMLKTRPRFSHKGTFGHACLIAGKEGMGGAAIMASKACMRSGAGKLTVHTPIANLIPLQITVPEAILHIERQSSYFTTPFETTSFNALAIGPGIGTEEATVRAFSQQLHYHQGPLVLDADALNILGSHPELMNKIPQDAILTPHKKELRGLIGATSNSYEELQLTRQLAQRYHIYVIVKGANSAIVTPEGDVIFNITGNPGMATAGSGDVLSGIILSLLAQDYSSLQASLLATYIHGLAGDLAAADLTQESLIATDLIDYLPKAFWQIEHRF
ncbi:MAG: NAD(P)H-hydrate dehydratase [Bacteroidaceae bacterium]|nr:NAD(P)H-hydrate dehydratase [Bacteroidaceae bacterium]